MTPPPTRHGFWPRLDGTRWPGSPAAGQRAWVTTPAAQSWVLISRLPGAADLTARPASRHGRATGPRHSRGSMRRPGTAWLDFSACSSAPEDRLPLSAARRPASVDRQPRTSQPARTGGADALRLLVRQHAVERRCAHRGGGLVRRRPWPARVRCGLVPAGPVPALRRTHRRHVPGCLRNGDAILLCPTGSCGTCGPWPDHANRSSPGSRTTAILGAPT